MYTPLCRVPPLPVSVTTYFILVTFFTPVSNPLILNCDQFDHGSAQSYCEPVDLATIDFDVAFQW